MFVHLLHSLPRTRGRKKIIKCQYKFCLCIFLNTTKRMGPTFKSWENAAETQFKRLQWEKREQREIRFTKFFYITTILMLLLKCKSLSFEQMTRLFAQNTHVSYRRNFKFWTTGTKKDDYNVWSTTELRIQRPCND